MAIDFKKLNTPEGREAARKSREEYGQKLQVQIDTNKHMLRSLEKVVDDDLYSDWERSFIRSVAFRINLGTSLSEKQQSIFDRIFEK